MPVEADDLRDVPAALRKAAARCVKRATRALDRPTGARVHEARKRLKRARAIGRLLRDAIGKREARRLDRALRDPGRSLSATRDAAVLVDALDSLGDRRAFAPLRRRLVARRAARLDVGPIRAALAEASALLDGVDAEPGGWRSIGRALRRSYRDGRRAYRAALDAGDDESWHDCRKRAKDLRHHLDWLLPIGPASLGPMIDRAKRLGDLLGEDHDLAVLSASVAGDLREALSAAGHARLGERVAARRATLRAEAIAVGAALFADRPGEFVRRLREAWRACA